MSTRLIASGLLGLAWGRMNPLWPLLLYYNQVVGAALKSSVNFRFNQQKWTRQGISSLEAADPRQARRVRRESAALHIASVLALVAAVNFATGALGFPDHQTWRAMLVDGEAGSDDFWLAAAVKRQTVGSPTLLPPERITANWEVFDGGEEIRLRGAGIGRTELHLVGFADAAETAGDRRLPCGEGEDACQIDGRVFLSNLTLRVGGPEDPEFGEK